MKTIFLSFSIANSSVSDYFIELSNRLSQEYRVIIITDNNEKNGIVLSPKIEIYQWPSRRPTTWKDFTFLVRKVRKYRPALMISIFGAVNLFLLVGFFFRVKNRIAWSRTISSQFKSKKSLQLRKKYIYKLATKVFANSKSTKLDLMHTFKVRENKIEVIYNAVKDPDINGAVFQNYKIVFVGRMHPSKGVTTLLEAMPFVLREFPATTLTLIGGDRKGKEINDLIEMAQEIGIGENISFSGNQPKREVLKEFSTAHITVVPSLVEAFGFVVIESFSVKTPVVGSNSSGIAEIIRDGKDGFLFQPGNANDLAFKILKIFENRDLRQTFSANCYQRFQEKFEVRNSVGKLVAKIQENMNG